MLLGGLLYVPLLKAVEHDPSPQRHLVGYDANDQVTSQPSLPFRLAMLPRFVVSQVSPYTRANSREAQEGQEGRLGRLESLVCPVVLTSCRHYGVLSAGDTHAE